MQPAVQAVRVSRAGPILKTRLWAGFILTAVPVLFLVFDVVIKLMVIEPVVESFTRLGYSAGIARGIGMLEAACLVLYLIPRTSVLGAVLLTGFLGGAIATHVRVGDPFLTHSFFPFYIGLLIWAGLYLRENRLHALLPGRR